MEDLVLLYLIGSSFIAFAIGYYIGLKKNLFNRQEELFNEINRHRAIHCDGIQVGIQIERERPDYFDVGHSQKHLAKELSSFTLIKKEHFKEVTKPYNK